MADDGGEPDSMAATTIIVIPCFNEAERLDLEAFRAGAIDLHRTRFLFVDDGSTDATSQHVGTLIDADADRFGLLRLEQNVGKAEAVRRGFLEAFESAPDRVGFWDADLATPLDAIAEFEAVLDGRPTIEVVFGSRVNLLGRAVRRNLIRHYIGRVFATAATAVLRLPIYDTQCGAKLFRVSDAMIEIFREPFISRWIFDVEILARMIKQRRGTPAPQVRDVVYELPLMTWIDVKGSRLRWHDFVIVVGDLMRIYLRYLRGLPRPAAAGGAADG